MLLSIVLLVSFTSCNSDARVVTSTNSPIPTNTEKPTEIFTSEPVYTNTATHTPTSTPEVSNDPRLIAIFGDENQDWFGRLAFSPNGIILAQAISSVKLWDVNTHELIREIKFPYAGQANKILFSPDGSLLAVNISEHHYSWGGSQDARLLVWDVLTGELMQDWEQEHATMSTYNGFDSEPTVYRILTDAMVFFPSSTNLAYANGNRVEIKDARTGEEIISWSLGDKMYASEMSIRGDGEFLYILMKWYKDLTFPSLYRWKFRVEIWNPTTKSFRNEIKFEEVHPSNADMWLVGQYVLYEDKIKPSLDALDLSLDERIDFPYRIGKKYFNADASLMVVIRDIGVDENEEGFEIWNTDTWRNIYISKPSSFEYWFSLSDVVFSPDNSMLAMDYDGRILLWNIRPTIQP